MSVTVMDPGPSTVRLRVRPTQAPPIRVRTRPVMGPAMESDILPALPALTPSAGLRGPLGFQNGSACFRADLPRKTLPHGVRDEEQPAFLGHAYRQEGGGYRVFQWRKGAYHDAGRVANFLDALTLVSKGVM